MEIENPLKLVNDLLIEHGLRPLGDVETLILRGSWEQDTYEAIASKTGYSDSYLAALERQWGQRIHSWIMLPCLVILTGERRSMFLFFWDEPKNKKY